MTNFVCTLQCTRIMLTVAMETMHFYSANNVFFEDKKSLHFWGRNEKNSGVPMKNCPGGYNIGQIN